MDNTAQQAIPVLLKTPLWQLHKELGGKLVPFAGYELPVQYDGMGVLKEHLHTRDKVSLFDVSHMGQVMMTGDIFSFEKLIPADLRTLKTGEMRYSVLLNKDGGIVDDLIVTRRDDNALYMVLNAACKEKDIAYIRAELGDVVTLDVMEDRALIAVQGPQAAAVVTACFPQAGQLSFMTALFEGGVIITRSGYTGEDGFEISVPASHAETLARQLMAQPDVKWAGLGARDSLRLEAGLCLYGHELDETITPVEAGLTWVIAKNRRDTGGFYGAEKILQQVKNGTAKKRVGIKPEGRAPVREGVELQIDGAVIGVVTSGGFGPTVNAPVAMGYVDAACAVVGTRIDALVRGTPHACTVVKLPFVSAQRKKD